jgi:hypothetical protein
MNKDTHCTIKIKEFAQINGWYWEITVPGEIHPRERIKEFILDDPGLGWMVKLQPMGSIHPVGKGCHVYRGGLSNKLDANAVSSSIILSNSNRIDNIFFIN